MVACLEYLLLAHWDKLWFVQGDFRAYNMTLSYAFHQTGIQIYIVWVYISLDTAFSAI